MPEGPKVCVVMGSDSDFPIIEGCLKILKDFGVETHVEICSAHRTPDRAAELAKNAEGEGYGAIIAAAGKAAHLPGVLAAHTVLPVIGIPIRSSLEGLDALLSIVQMPAGVPVATVAINSGENAALLAVQIMGGSYPELRRRMHEYKRQMVDAFEDKNRKLQEKMKGMQL